MTYFLNSNLGSLGCRVPNELSRFSSFVAALLLVTTTPAHGATYNVDPINGNDTNSGSSWGTAKASIQAAVDAAKDTDTILVNAGVFRLSDTLNITKAVVVKSLMGAHYTVIDGGYPAQAIRCVRISNQNAVFEGFTVQNGAEGVMFDGEASGKMRNCVVTGVSGNAVFFNHGGTAQSCTIVKNGVGLFASDMGGGGDPAVNLIVSGNTINWLTEDANIVCDTCVTEDPHFAADNDFRLLADSPCIDAGRELPWMATSIAAEGNPRVGKGQTDVGAYEFVHLEPVLNSENGHHYAYVEARLGWDQARSLALRLRHGGYPGYLVTISSQAEQDFIVRTLAKADGFLGGSDSEVEGDWKWMDGPERGLTFFRGRYPAADRKTLIYSNWGGNEPNDYDNRPNTVPFSGEDYLGFSDPAFGKWNDLPGGPFTLPGLFVEFSEPWPVLRVAVSGQTADLSWPTDAVGFVLEASEGMGPSGWIGVSKEIQVDGGNNLVRLPVGGFTQFYRLRRP